MTNLEQQAAQFVTECCVTIHELADPAEWTDYTTKSAEKILLELCQGKRQPDRAKLLEVSGVAVFLHKERLQSFGTQDLTLCGLNKTVNLLAKEAESIGLNQLDSLQLCTDKDFTESPEQRLLMRLSDILQYALTIQAKQETSAPAPPEEEANGKEQEQAAADESINKKGRAMLRLQYYCKKRVFVSKKQIAEDVGCSQALLSKDEDFSSGYNAYKTAFSREPKRGYKNNETGDIEAYDW
ncbi:MAG: hypothetical protein AB7F23_10160 [Phycisphaerae bacterium]